MTHLQNWTMAALLAAILLITGALLDGPSDIQAEADTADALADARRDHGAATLCRQLHGPQAAHLWDAGGSLICLGAAGQTHASR